MSYWPAPRLLSRIQAHARERDEGGYEAVTGQKGKGHTRGGRAASGRRAWTEVTELALDVGYLLLAGSFLVYLALTDLVSPYIFFCCPFPLIAELHVFCVLYIVDLFCLKTHFYKRTDKTYLGIYVFFGEIEKLSMGIIMYLNCLCKNAVLFETCHVTNTFPTVHLGHGLEVHAALFLDAAPVVLWLYGEPTAMGRGGQGCEEAGHAVAGAATGARGCISAADGWR